MKKAQSAVEFVLLISFLLMAAVPIFFILSDYSFKSSTEASSSQLEATAHRLVDESREIFFLGLYSKDIITVRMPKQVTSMQTIYINGAQDEYYLLINYTKDGNEIQFPIKSEVPLFTGDCTSKPCYTASQCTYCSFNADDYSEGIKNFRLEAQPWGSMTGVNITHIDWN